MVLNDSFFFFKQRTASEISACLVGWEMCIRDGVLCGHGGGHMRTPSRAQHTRHKTGMRAARMRHARPVQTMPPNPDHMLPLLHI